MLKLFFLGGGEGGCLSLIFLYPIMFKLWASKVLTSALPKGYSYHFFYIRDQAPRLKLLSLGWNYSKTFKLSWILKLIDRIKFAVLSYFAEIFFLCIITQFINLMVFSTSTSPSLLFHRREHLLPGASVTREYLQPQNSILRYIRDI